MQVDVVQYGVGEIGKEIARLVLNRKAYKLVEAVDLAEDKIGKDLGSLFERKVDSGIVISSGLESSKSSNCRLAFHSTSSRLEQVYPQIKELINAGLNVISTAEELAYPYMKDEDLANSIDTLAKEHGVTVLGIGVNPGFAMDLFPLTFTGISRALNKISVTRIQDASVRREPLQRKVGVGLTGNQFNSRVKKSGGHVGLKESAVLLGTGLGWRLTEVTETIEPVFAEESMATDYFQVSSGEVIGINQTAKGIIDGKAKIVLTLKMYLNAGEPVDRVELSGEPDIELEVKGGIHGDIATPAAAVNAARKVLESAPGLITVLDLYPFLYSFEQSRTPHQGAGLVEKQS